MNCLKMRISNKKILILPLIIILSLIISFYFGEDTLGGAKHDHFFILKFSLLFSENFSETFNNYGIGILQARNSPIFSIFQSLFISLGTDLDILRYLNSLIIIPIFYFFYKSLKIKYPYLSYEVKIIFTSILFLSPTIRSLIIWPYPLIYGLVFFIISNYFFIKFEAVDNEKKKIIFSLYNVFFLAVAAYFTPNFALFSLFYLYKFFLHFKFSKNLYIIIIISEAVASSNTCHCSRSVFGLTTAIAGPPPDRYPLQYCSILPDAVSTWRWPTILRNAATNCVFFEDLSWKDILPTFNL